MPTAAEYRQYLTLPQVRAALDTIAWAEGGAYNRLYGGGTFSSSQHPNQRVTAGSYTSTAAGRYQFLYSTWIEIKNRLGLADFGPESQDIAAVDLIRQRGQLPKLLAGDFEGMIRGLGCAWAALPFSGCNQNERSLSQVMSKFNGYLAGYGGSGTVGTTFPDFGTSQTSETSETLLYGLGLVLLVLILDR